MKTAELVAKLDEYAKRVSENNLVYVHYTNGVIWMGAKPNVNGDWGRPSILAIGLPKGGLKRGKSEIDNYFKDQ